MLKVLHEGDEIKSDILCVIVIYKLMLKNSISFNSIINSQENINKNRTIIIYDNSPESQNIPNSFPIQSIYFHDKDNGGLSAAYNFAVNYCSKKQIPWLLLLDQDTSLTKEYFSELDEILPTINLNEEVVCIVPKILSGRRKISPIILQTGGFIKKIKNDIHGIADFSITGINSGTLLKVDFIKSLGGFNPLFRIDMLDYWYFKMITKYHKKSYIMKSTLQHDLSIMDYSTVSVDRYENIIKAEFIFYRNYCSKNDLIIFCGRLFFRLIKQCIKVKNKKMARVTFNYLFCLNA